MKESRVFERQVATGTWLFAILGNMLGLYLPAVVREFGGLNEQYPSVLSQISEFPLTATFATIIFPLVVVFFVLWIEEVKSRIVAIYLGFSSVAVIQQLLGPFFY